MIDQNFIVNWLSIFKLRSSRQRGSNEDHDNSDNNNKDSKYSERVDAWVRTRRTVESSSPTPTNSALRADDSLKAFAALTYWVQQRLNKTEASSWV